MSKKIDEMIGEASEAIGARMVFGQPYEKNGVTVIPAARVMGGVGRGEGTGPQTEGTGADGEGTPITPTGSGAGYGVIGRPAGAFVVKENGVTWLPAVDVNRMLFGFQVVLVVFLLVVRSVMNARAKAGK